MFGQVLRTFLQYFFSGHSEKYLELCQPSMTKPFCKISNGCQLFTISAKSSIKDVWQPRWHRSGVLIVNFEHISHLDLVFLLLIEQANADWEGSKYASDIDILYESGNNSTDLVFSFLLPMCLSFKVTFQVEYFVSIQISYFSKDLH